MRNKSWPYWEHWQFIFGKDRASGTIAEDLMEAINDLYSTENLQASTEGGGHSGTNGEQAAADPANPTPTPEGVTDSSCQSAGVNEKSNGRGKKRKTDQGIDGLIEMLGKMHEDTNARLECLTMRIGYEFDLSKARKEVYELLGRLPGLTRVQKFDVGEIILEKVERLDFFLSMPEEDRLAYVCHALAKYV